MLSGGLDGLIIQYDYEKCVQVASFKKSENAVVRMDSHRFDKNLVGMVDKSDKCRIFDLRSSREDIVIGGIKQMTSFKFHLTDENSVLIGGQEGELQMFDMRNVQTPSMKYQVIVRRKQKGQQGRPLTSIDMHPDGKRVLLSVQNFWPVMFDLHTQDSTVFHDLSLKNYATVKTASFSPDGLMVFSGSDSRHIIAFDVPVNFKAQRPGWFEHDQQLVANRQHVIDRADEYIYGHINTPNVIVCHPDLPYCYSSGMEKNILCHSKFSHGTKWVLNPEVETSDELTLVPSPPMIPLQSFPGIFSNNPSTLEDLGVSEVMEIHNQDMEFYFSTGMMP